MTVQGKLETAKRYYDAKGVRRHGFLRTASNELYVHLANVAAEKPEVATGLIELGRHMERLDRAAGEKLRLKFKETVARRVAEAEAKLKRGVKPHVVLGELRSHFSVQPVQEFLKGKRSAFKIGKWPLRLAIGAAALSTAIAIPALVAHYFPSHSTAFKEGIGETKGKRTKVIKTDAGEALVVKQLSPDAGEFAPQLAGKSVAKSTAEEPKRPAPKIYRVATFEVLRAPGITWEEKLVAFAREHRRQSKRPAGREEHIVVNPFGRLTTGQGDRTSGEYGGGSKWEELPPTPEAVNRESQRILAEARARLAGGNTVLAGLAYYRAIELGSRLGGVDLENARRIASEKNADIYHMELIHALKHWQPQLEQTE